MKAIVNALTLALLDAGLTDHLTARAFAVEFVEQNAELFAAPAIVVQPQQVVRSPGGQTTVTGTVNEPAEGYTLQTWQEREDSELAPARFRQRIVGPDGLTDQQREAVGTVGLCPNCQQPNTDHLPACALASGYDKRAVTKTPLPPVQ